MARHVYYVALLLCVCGNRAFSQSASSLIGARAAGVGYSSSGHQEEWSLFNNVAGLAVMKSPVAAVSYDARPTLPGADRMALVLAMPNKFGTLGLGVLKFGDDLYSEQIVSAGFSNTIGITSLGVKLNYIQYNASGFGTKGVVSVSAGGITEIISNVFLNAHILNINQPVISQETNERLPTTLIAGFAYRHTTKLLLSTEIEKDLDHKPLWKAGLEYSPMAKVSFRAGVNVNPNATFFGAGFRSKKFSIDYALHYSLVPGVSHQLAIGYQFIKKHETVTE